MPFVNKKPSALVISKKPAAASDVMPFVNKKPSARVLSKKPAAARDCTVQQLRHQDITAHLGTELAGWVNSLGSGE
eukprot:16442079-Heterocapsa_arctica.AAC.1